MDPAKVEAVHDWPIPNNKREVQQFIGFCNYYRRFILGFSAIARPLHRLTGNVPWEWTEECTQAFETLKQRICDQPVLAVPDDEGQFRIEADSSNFANGAILSQLTNGKWHPIAFRSRSLTPTERNYEIYDKEMLAIMDSIDEWRQYLLGARQPFEVWTDHLNLQYFRKPQKLNYRQARWLTELQEYDFKLLHKPGSQMTKADLLSRRADHTRGENDNANVTLLKPELFLREIVVEALDKDFVERAIRARANKDRVVVKALAEGQEDWEDTDDGLTSYQGRIYIPRDNKLREDIIRAHHDSRIEGHPGKYKTQELINRNYWWPGIRHDVRRYVTGCDACQRANVRNCIRQLVQFSARISADQRDRQSRCLHANSVQWKCSIDKGLCTQQEVEE